MLSQRTVELAASNLELQLEIAQRKAAEAALKKSEHHYSQLLEQSDRLQEQLRQLSRQILSAQEEERKEISRELHDVIAQTLTGINVRLAALNKEAAINTKGLDRNIARTQRLVEKSVDIVHQFARELRPAVLDDLGLIPALHSFMKNFTGADRRPHSFDGLCGGGTIGHGPAHGALSRRPGSADQCGPPCASQPGGSEHPETAGLRLHENKRRRQILSSGTRVARQGKQTAGTARHEGAGGDGRRPFWRRIRARPGHHRHGWTCPSSVPERRAEKIRQPTLEMSMKQITVLLAEDHTIVREGFRKMLELEDDSKWSAKRKTAARRSPWPKNFVPTWC